MNEIPTFISSNITPCMLLCVSVGIFVFLLLQKPSINKQAQRAKPIKCSDFLNQWDTYRKVDKPGCYIISIYKRKPTKHKTKRIKKYSEIYIGQSINVYRRVFNHFTGHGNGDVYADVKYQRHVFVKFVPCAIEQLNEYEKYLISKYNATESYNRTKGGAKLSKK